MPDAGGRGKGFGIFDLRFVIYDWIEQAGACRSRIGDCGMRIDD